MRYYVIMPRSDYTKACDMVRNKLGQETLIKSGEFVDKLNEIKDVDISGVTATANDVLIGKKIVDSNGNIIDGTIPNNSNFTSYIKSKSDKIRIEKGYYSENSKIEIYSEDKAKITPDNILRGITILGIDGNANKIVRASGSVSVSSSNQTPSISNSSIKQTSKIVWLVVRSNNSSGFNYVIPDNTSLSSYTYKTVRISSTNGAVSTSDWGLPTMASGKITLPDIKMTSSTTLNYDLAFSV